MDSTQFTQARTKVLRWSQQRLADELGMARNSISRMESGVMPVERRTELALRWLMYSECNIVEHHSESSSLDKAPSHDALSQTAAIEELPSPVAGPVADEPLYVSMFSMSPLLSDITSAQLDEVLSKFKEVAGEFGLLQNADFIKLYVDSGYTTWFNRRGGRALASQFLGLSV